MDSPVQAVWYRRLPIHSSIWVENALGVHNFILLDKYLAVINLLSARVH